MQIQYLQTLYKHLAVVICFKFSNFAYANTVNDTQKVTQLELLFALNLVTLLMQIQFLNVVFASFHSCYLL